MIRIKRAYDPPSSEDGERILVDRLWPRGVSKTSLRIDEWRRDIAPTDGLRRWFGHNPERYAEFRERYRKELIRHRDALADLALASEQHVVTLVFAARDSDRCNASVLKELLDEVV